MDAGTKNLFVPFGQLMRIDTMTYFTRSLLISSLSAIALLASGCAEGASTASATPSSSDSPAENAASPAVSRQTTDMTWDIVQGASHIKFTAQQEGADFSGEFTDFSGLIAFDPDAPETGSIKITIPLGSVDAGSKDRNSTLPGKVWFSTKRFPTAVFSSDDITRDGDGYIAVGELTLKGKSVPLELPFDLIVDGSRAVMTGDLVMDRTDWDVGSDPWDTDEWVSRNVTLDIKVTANRTPK